LLLATNCGTDGRGYEQLHAAFEWLGGTRMETNVTTGDVEVLDGFGLIDRYRIVRETRDGRMQEVEVMKLSDWVFNAVKSREVLTLHCNYFRLHKPLERRLYEIARKHCGAQSEWAIGLEKLKYKCGSHSTDKEFKRLVQKIVEEDQAHQHIPDYSLRIGGEKAVFTILLHHANPGAGGWADTAGCRGLTRRAQLYIQMGCALLGARMAAMVWQGRNHPQTPRGTFPQLLPRVG
jgi:hypothetical protein